MSKKRKKIGPIGLFVFIAVVVIVYVIFIKPNYYRMNGGEIFFEPVKTYSFNTSDLNSLYAYKGYIYMSGKNGFKKVSQQNENIWSKSYSMETPLFVHNQGYMAVADISGKKAYLFSPDGFVKEFTLSWPILKIEVNENGFIAIVQEKGDTHIIELYNSAGKLLTARNTIFKKDGFPIGLEISPDAMDMITTNLYVNENRIQTKMTFFNYDEKSENLDEYITGGFLMEGTITPEIHMMNAKRIFAAGDNKLFFYNLERTPELIKEIDITSKIHSVSYTKADVVIHFGEQIAESQENLANSVAWYDQNGELVNTFKPSEVLKSVFSDQKYTYVVTSSKIYQYEGSKLMWKSATYRDIQQIYFMGGKSYLMVYPTGYEIVNIKDI